MDGYHYDGPTTEATLERRLQASPDDVFDVCVKTERVSRWLFADRDNPSECDLDVRPGGAYRIVRRADGNEYVAVGEYVRIERPRRFEFTFSMPQFAADVGTVLLVFEPEQGGTFLSLTQTGMRPGYEEVTMDGWNGMLDLLEAELARGA